MKEGKISESVLKRIEAIKSAKDSDELKKCLCPFFKLGLNPDCVGCEQLEKDLEDCKDDYLQKIAVHPMDIWSEDFDAVKVKSRDKISYEDAKQLGTSCDTCYMYDKCPYYKAGYVCAIEWGSNKPKTPADMMDFLIDLQYKRVRRSSTFEQADGGVPDAGLSGEIDRLSGLMLDKANLNAERFSLNVQASSTSTESSGGGILAKIFGGGGSPKAIEDKPAPKIELPVEEADFEEVKDKPKKKRTRKSDE